MPIIARFHGISIRMFFQQTEHTPPHLHVSYGHNVAAVDIRTGSMMEGYLPPRELQTIQAWVLVYKQELLRMWDTQHFTQLPPLERN